MTDASILEAASDDASIRLDKWLWFARFFKSRSLATKFVDAGKARIRGSVAIIERRGRRLARTLVGPGLPVWSVAFMPDSRTILTGGNDRMVRRWDATTGDPIGAVAMGAVEDPLAAYAGDHGAEVFRACVACHTLSPDEGNRAGPPLPGIFGRKIASLPGYRFSEALTKLDIVWTPETVAKLFEIGPSAYTPGTNASGGSASSDSRSTVIPAPSYSGLRNSATRSALEFGRCVPASRRIGFM